MRRKGHYLCGFCLMAVLMLSACRSSGEEDFQEADSVVREEETADESTSETELPPVIYVYVCGEVVSPGVYELREGDRVIHALEAAGGMTAEADPTWLNQAEVLGDGARVCVPDQEETRRLREEGRTPEQETADEEKKIDLNTATRDELMTLSGIGETKADSIIQYREEHGRFQSVEEIQQVDGIKSGTYNKIKDQIRVS